MRKSAKFFVYTLVLLLVLGTGTYFTYRYLKNKAFELIMKNAQNLVPPPLAAPSHSGTPEAEPEIEDPLLNEQSIFSLTPEGTISIPKHSQSQTEKAASQAPNLGGNFSSLASKVDEKDKNEAYGIVTSALTNAEIADLLRQASTDFSGAKQRGIDLLTKRLNRDQKDRLLKIYYKYAYLGIY